MAREFEVVVLGATGNAGRAIAQALGSVTPPLTSWAIAGRTRSKLEAIASELPADCNCGIVSADCCDYDSLLSMAQRARVVLTATGPYTLYGEPVIRACIEAGAHYADITGEGSWVAQMKQQHGAAAKEAGVALVNFCGYDCVPPELSVAIANMSMTRSGTRLDWAQCVFATEGSGGMPRGTLLSVLHMMKQGPIGIARDQYNTVSTLVAPASQWACWRALFRWWLPWYSGCELGFTMPNPMGAINIPVVYGSAAEQGFGDFKYHDRIALPSKLRSVLALKGLLVLLPAYALLGPIWVVVMLLLPLLDWIFSIEKKLAARSYQGNKDCWVQVKTSARAVSGSGCDLEMRVPGDPGIYATAFLACHTAIGMLEAKKLRSGFTTPVVALGAKAFKHRLHHAGAQFNVFFTKGQ